MQNPKLCTQTLIDALEPFLDRQTKSAYDAVYPLVEAMLKFSATGTPIDMHKPLTIGMLANFLKNVDPNLEVRLEYDGCLISNVEYAGIIKIDVAKEPTSFSYDIENYTPEFFILADAEHFGRSFKERAEDYDVKCTTVDFYNYEKDAS